jgi:hypothetical protein
MSFIPAFPYTDSCDVEPGMSLRDYFAAKAMQAFLSENSNVEWEHIAIWSYKVADKMLAEREKQ